MKSLLQKTIASLSAVTLGMAMTLAHAQQAETPNWYVNVDVKQFQNSNFKNRINFEDEQVDVLVSILGKEVAEKTECITFYGTGSIDQGTTSVAKGDYAGKYNAIVENFQALGLTTKETTKYGVVYSGILSKQEFEKRFKSSAVDVEVDSDKDNEEERYPVYAGVKDNQYIIASRVKGSVVNWLSGTQTWPADNNGAMFEVVVDVQQAMLHGGMNLDAVNDIEFESISAKQIKQVSVQYSETNNIVDVEIGMESHTVETANQVTAVIRGLVALQSLASDNQDLKQLARSLQINQNGAKISLKLSGTAETFENVLDKHSESEAEYEEESEEESADAE